MAGMEVVRSCGGGGGVNDSGSFRGRRVERGPWVGGLEGGKKGFPDWNLELGLGGGFFAGGELRELR